MESLGYYIEYFGLEKTENYDKKMKVKIEFIMTENLKVIDLHQDDLKNLESKLKVLCK